MKRLFFNDSSEFFFQLGQAFEERLVGDDGIVANNYYDVIYHLDYTDFSPDLIIINCGDVGILPNPTESNLGERFSNWVERLLKAEYFPVELGKICKEICKEKGKSEPKILILSASDQCIEKFIQHEADSLDLKSDDVLKDFNDYLGKITK